MIIIVPSDFKTISNRSLAIVTSSLSFFKMRGIEVSSGETPRRFPPFIQSTDLFTQLRVLGTSPASCSGQAVRPRAAVRKAQGNADQERERPKGYAERLALKWGYALALASRRAPREGR